jgi:hypothetical protein
VNMLFDGRQAERFAELLDDNGSGSRRRSHTRAEAQLAELVTIGDQLGGVRVAGPTSDFRSGLRAQLMAVAERDGIGVTSVDLEPAPAKPRRSSRARVAIIAGIAGGTLAVSGISMASGDANPGDPLYSVKRSTEKAQLALASSDLSRGQLYLEFARTRLGEAHAVRTDAEDFGGAMVDMDANTVDGVRLLATSAMAHKDSTALDAIDRFVDSQRNLVTQLTSVTGPSSRAKVDTSLALLDAIAARSHSLRDALACGAGATQKADSLGPLAAPCPAPLTAQPQISTPQKATSGGVTTNKPAVAPSTAGEVATVAPSASASPAPQPSESEDSGLLGELGRILGGLLGS